VLNLVGGDRGDRLRISVRCCWVVIEVCEIFFGVWMMGVMQVAGVVFAKVWFSINRVLV